MLRPRIALPPRPGSLLHLSGRLVGDPEERAHLLPLIQAKVASLAYLRRLCHVSQGEKRDVTGTHASPASLDQQVVVVVVEVTGGMEEERERGCVGMIGRMELVIVEGKEGKRKGRMRGKREGDDGE